MMNNNHREDLERLLSILHLRQNSPTYFPLLPPHPPQRVVNALYVGGEADGHGERRGKIGCVNFVK